MSFDPLNRVLLLFLCIPSFGRANRAETQIFQYFPWKNIENSKKFGPGPAVPVPSHPNRPRWIDWAHWFRNLKLAFRAFQGLLEKR